MPTFHDLQQGSAEWLAFRKDKITATDIATICGVNPYKSPYMLWQEKLGLKGPESENDAMREGKLLESEAIHKLNKIWEGERLYKPCVVTHSNNPKFMASIDAYDKDSDCLAEIKCGQKSYFDALDDFIQEYYKYQMQWEMYVLDIDHFMEFMCYRPNQETIFIEYLYDQDLIDQMIVKAQEFLEMLQTVTPPPFTDLDYEDKSHDPGWDNLMAYYIDYYDMEMKGKAGKEHVKKLLIEASNGRNCKGSNSKFTSYLMKGKIDYDQIPELQGLNLDQYRKPDVQCYKVTFNKD